LYLKWFQKAQFSNFTLEYQDVYRISTEFGNDTRLQRKGCVFVYVYVDTSSNASSIHNTVSYLLSDGKVCVMIIGQYLVDEFLMFVVCCVSSKFFKTQCCMLLVNVLELRHPIILNLLRINDPLPLLVL